MSLLLTFPQAPPGIQKSHNDLVICEEGTLLDPPTKHTLDFGSTNGVLTAVADPLDSTRAKIAFSMGSSVNVGDGPSAIGSASSLSKSSHIHKLSLPSLSAYGHDSISTTSTSFINISGLQLTVVTPGIYQVYLSIISFCDSASAITGEIKITSNAGSSSTYSLSYTSPQCGFIPYNTESALTAGQTIQAQWRVSIGGGGAAFVSNAGRSLYAVCVSPS